MSVLAANKLTMSFGESTVFSNVSFEVEKNDRIGFIGVNGAGKTTLFKLLTGEHEATAGYLTFSRDVTIGYMSQHVCRDASHTAYEEMLTVFSSLIASEHELEAIADAIDRGADELDGLLERQQLLQTEFERSGGLSYKSRARSALLGLGFTQNDIDMPCSCFSGGQLSKIALGKLLLSGAQLLLLDEPTNHLDIGSVEWLEGWLNDYRGAFIVISHDRYFLDRVTNKTMELERGALTVTKGNYSRFMELKRERLEYARRHYENTMREVHRIEGIIEQQKTFSQERNFITIAHKQKSIDRLLDGLEKPDSELRGIDFSFKASTVSGNDVLIVERLKKGFGEKLLFDDVAFTLKRGEHVFLLGDNGCGKSTFFNILMRRINADSGIFHFGANVKIGYFEQTLAGLDNSKTALDEVWDCYRSKTELEIRKAMALFLFTGESVYKQVGLLSGGEKARVALLKLMLSGANLLLLDEPTNHLDIGSREALEAALSDYDGTLFIISHDRYFINRCASRVLWMFDGGVQCYNGNYDFFCEHFERPQQATKQKKQSENADSYRQRKEHDSALRRSAGRLSRCEGAIEQAENELKKLQEELNTPECAADYERVLTLSNEIAALTDRQEALLEQWEELSAEYESLSKG